MLALFSEIQSDLERISLMRTKINAFFTVASV